MITIWLKKLKTKNDRVPDGVGGVYPAIFRCSFFASGCRASFIFSLLPPDAYAQRFSLFVFRLRLSLVVHFQPLAA